ncbi:rifin PIR protein, putative [Plasmodium gaboni]|uniref:Rifin PIR protein, putative n=1 Tax=Plasmodium gaboni TaxID=647221 RepID=A0ABY0KW23_9APIC|nr:rifin PIR protein, putative [Plasmodium gaboni]
MKVHYINILLLKFLLNILTHNRRNHKIPIPHKPKIHKILCEYDIYTSIYDNDPEMKSLMENFDRQTSERFREYDQRIQQNRMKCKEQCDKDIQNLILKDKIEKELKDTFGALQPYVDSDSTPTCMCEKSLADKTDKICLNCGKNMGTITPSWSLVSCVGYTGWLNFATAADTTGFVATNDIVAIITAIKTGVTSITFFPFGVAIVALIHITVIVIFLYVLVTKKKKKCLER